MTARDPPDVPERPTRDVGELYVYAEEDLARLMGEVYAHAREMETVDNSDAVALTDYCYRVLTDDL